MMDQDANITNLNATNSDQSAKFNRKISEIIYFVVMAYVFIALTIYEVRSFFYGRGIPKKQMHRSRLIVVYGILMRAGTYIATVVIMMLRVVALIRILEVPLSKLSCDFSVRCKPVFWSVTMFFVYLVLWCRQRSVYENPAMGCCTNKFTRFFSIAIAIIFVPVHVVYSVFIILSQKGELMEGVCIEVPLLKKSQIVIMSSIAFTLVCTQSMLMFLFGWPLIQHIRSSKISKATEKLMPFLRKTFILTLICAISDAFGPIGLLLVKDIGSFKFYYFGASLIVDVICINLNFAAWRERLLPVKLTTGKSKSDANSNYVNKIDSRRGQSTQSSTLSTIPSTVGHVNKAMDTNEVQCD